MRLDPQYRLIFGSGGELATPAVERMERATAALSPADAVSFRRFLVDNRLKLANFKTCLESPFRGWRDTLRWRVLKLLPLLRPWLSLDQELARYFRDPRVRLAFSFQSKYLGMSPFKCPSLFSILSYLEYEYGVYHPIGGCAAVTLAMARIVTNWAARFTSTNRLRSFFADGTTLDLRADIGQMSIGLEAFGPGTVTGYRRLMEQSARLHRVSDRFFFWRPVGGLRDMVKVKGAFEPSLLLDLLALQPGRSMAAMVRSHVPDGRVAQMLDDFTQYVGSAPDTSPAVLCGIAHMQTNEGVWYPAGGIAAVPRALTRLASELGVEIRTQTGVRRILQAGKGCACGLETEAGERIPLDAVVSNSDAVRTHRELLGGNEAVRFDRRRT